MKDLLHMGVFHESWQDIRQQHEGRGLWCLAAAEPLPNTTSPSHLDATAYQVEIHPLHMSEFHGSWQYDRQHYEECDGLENLEFFSHITLFIFWSTTSGGTNG